jgi:UDP-glucose 4-epimerase
LNRETKTLTYRGARVLVLGATGFIGRWVARALYQHGSDAYLVVRSRAAAENIFSKYAFSGRVLSLDVRDFDRVRRLFQEIRPSITFNLAGYGVNPSERDEQTAYLINSDLIGVLCKTVNMMRQPGWLGQQIVHVGSGLEYGAIGGSLSEDSVPNPSTLYGRSKLAGTHLLKNYCEEYGIKGLTARLFTVYGPGEREGRLLPSLLHSAKTKKTLPMTAGEQKRDFTYVEDVAEGLLRLSLTAAQPGEIVNLATGRLTPVRSFVETAASILHIPHDKLLFGSLPVRAEEMKHSEVSLARLQRTIGWIPPTGIEEGIVKTIHFENSHLMENAKCRNT